MGARRMFPGVWSFQGAGNIGVCECRHRTILAIAGFCQFPSVKRPVQLFTLKRCALPPVAIVQQTTVCV